MAIAVAFAVIGLGVCGYAFLPATRVRHLSTPPMGTLSANTQPNLLAQPPLSVADHTTELFEEDVVTGSGNRL
jgi:hypothetical protein